MAKNLRLVKLETLQKIKENGYESTYIPGRNYNPDEVDAEIKRKQDARKKREIRFRLRNNKV